MSQRCCSRYVGSRPFRSIQQQQYQNRPFNRSNTTASSSHSQPSRKLSGSEHPSQSRKWQRPFLIGLTLGIITTQSYLYYKRYSLQSSFVKYKLVAQEPVSSTASIFHLAPAELSTTSDSFRDAWRRGIWNVQFKQPQLQIVRAYTPLPPFLESKEQGQVRSAEQDTAPRNERDYNLRFLIRHDPHGEVSSYLHRLPIGAEIELRGPNIEYDLTSDVRQVVFFAGGTGIAPALQIAHAMFGSEGRQGERDTVDKRKKLHILWASRKREDCAGGSSDKPVEDPMPPKATWSGLFAAPKSQVIAPPDGQARGIIVSELEALKSRYPGQVTVEYFVNEENTWIDDDVVFRTLSRFDDKDFSHGKPSESEQRQILISGPNGFITYLAGPKEWRNGKEEQGNVSRIIAHAIAQNPHHVKVWKV